MRKILLIMLSFVFAACANMMATQTTTEPTTRTQKTYSAEDAIYSDEYIDITLAPIKMGVTQGTSSGDHVYRAFDLTINNKTGKDIKLSWDDSYYIENGEAKEGFMYEGIVYSKRTEPKQDLLILPNSIITKRIYPTYKVQNFGYSSSAARYGMPTGWGHMPMTDGEYGAYLIFNSTSYDKKIKLITLISEEIVVIE